MVFVYRNLKFGRKTKPLYSVMQDGRVIARLHRVLISGATFVVRKAGRDKAIREGQKNVHAFVKGYLVDEKGVFGIDANGRNLPARITYTILDGFRYEGSTVIAARGVLLNEDGITACYLECA